MTDIKFKEEVSSGIKKGVDTLANAVKVTLGPKGRNVIIGKANGEDPQVTKDGVTVAKSIELEDRLENMGATVVKRVAEKSNDNAGDGTTTATVLTQAILEEGIKLVGLGFNPIEIKRGIDKATRAIVEKLNDEAIPVPHGSAMIEQIATVSANNDPEIGKIVADAFNSIGKDGAVSVEPGTGFETTFTKIDGLQFDRGMLSTYFSTSPDKAEVSMQQPLILLVDGKLSTTEQIMAVLEPVIKTGKPLLVVAEDVTGNALSTLILNKMRGGHQICAIKTPGFGGIQKELLEDIATIIGAKVVPEDMVQDIEEQYLDQLLGTASAVKIDQMSTVIMGGKGKEKEISARIQELKSAMVKTNITTYELDKLEERMAKLAGGVAVISVGANSELDMQEKKDRYDDAKEAVVSALEEGVVLGGGMALLNCQNLDIRVSEDTDEEIGVQLILKALESPLRVICDNAEISADVVINDAVNNSGDIMNVGYDARRGMLVDMLEAGILDPKKVTRIALESAASVAGTLLTTACAVIEQ